MPRPRSIQELHNEALRFAMEYIANNAFDLPQEISEAQFKHIMDNITRSMITAWANGYQKAQDDHGKR